MDLVSAYVRAGRTWVEEVAGIGRDRWAWPTPCSGWDVRALVAHVVGEDRWTPPLIAGATIGEVGDRFDGDLLGDDPVGACREATAAAIEAVTGPGALDRTVHLSFGDAPATEYVAQLFADHLIHRWDLAVAVGADTRLDPELVDACARWFAANEEAYRAAGAIGPRAPSASDDPQSRLLAAFGRQAPTSGTADRAAARGVGASVAASAPVTPEDAPAS